MHIEFFVNLNKKGGAAPMPPMVAPKAPVEEASVQIENKDTMRNKTGKSSLKMPVTTSSTTGVNV